MEKPVNGTDHSRTELRTGAAANASNKLAWRWLTNSEAFLAARRSAIEMEAMRVGHGLLTQFEGALVNGELEVLLLPHGCAALIGWGECEDGKTLNIMTTVGREEHSDIGLMAIEYAGAQRGAKVVISVGRKGWKGLAQRHGYQVQDCILMRKKLDANTIS
jgi:hypothetical protein